MNYLKLYENIIFKANSETRQRDDGMYYESHHIIPRSWCKGEMKYLVKDYRNLVLLTAREHYLCHWLLAKEFVDDYKMLSAFLYMSGISNKNKNSKFYENVKEKNSTLRSEKLRSNTEEFIQKSIEIHGDRYDYSKSIYGKNMYDKLIIICKIHGEFLQDPCNHLKGSGCRNCFFENKPKIKRKILKSSTDEFVIKARRIHNDKYDYTKTSYGYNAFEKVIITCPFHGDFEQTPNNHLRNKGCKKCSDYRNKLTHSKPVIQIERDTNKEVFCWLSITDATIDKEFHGSAISLVCNGKRKSAGGFIWRYIDK